MIPTGFRTSCVPPLALAWTFRRRPGLLACLLLCAALLLGVRAEAGQDTAVQGTAGQGAAVPALQIVAFGDLRGELLPCGCSPEGQLGGLPRRETYWNGLLKRIPSGGDPPVLVDLGNNFPAPSAQGALKLDAIQGFLGKMPVAAILPGPNELQMGFAALAPGLPYTVTNNDVPGAFAPSQSVVRNGQRVLVLGYLSPSLVYQGSQDRFRLVPLDLALLSRYESLARQAPQRTLLLFRGDDRELDIFARSGLFAAIVAGNPSGDELTAVSERRAGGAAIPQVPTKGMGAVVLTLGAAPFARVDQLTDKFPDGPEALAALKIYDGRVKALFFEQLAGREARAQDSPYSGAAACQDCHAPEYAIWQASSHPQALRGLDKVGKQFDPECLECHVAGFNRAGFVSAGSTPHLAGVQCESCHGPGRAHVADSVTAKMAAVGTGTSQPGEATCRTCHRGAHSPTFAFSAYWPRILHGARTAGR